MVAQPQEVTTKDLPEMTVLYFKDEDQEMLRTVKTQFSTFLGKLGSLKNPCNKTKRHIDNILQAREAFKSNKRVEGVKPKTQVLTDIQEFSVAVGEMSKEARLLVAELTKIHDKLNK